MRTPLNQQTWLRRMLTMIAVAPFILLWGEVFTRLLLPQNVDSRMNILRPDPVVGFTYEPNSQSYEKGREYNALYEINSLGLRDREYGPKKDGVFRILLIGDSMAASHGLSIEESLSRQLEQALQTEVDAELMPVRIEVVNTACGGYSPFNYWKAYRRWAPVFQPDVVVVGISPDDYDCSNEESQYLIEGGAILAVVKNSENPPKFGRISLTSVRKWLSWNSEFYILLRNFLYYNDYAGRVSSWMSAKMETELGPLEPYVAPQLPSMQKAWSKTYFYLKKLHKETVTDGVPLIIMSIPLKLESDYDQYQQALASTRLTEDRVDLGQVMREVSTFCTGENLPLLDPRMAIRKRHAEVPCYFIYDSHWNAEGIRVAVSSMARQWRELRIPPWDDRLLGKCKEKAPNRIQGDSQSLETAGVSSRSASPDR